MVSFIAFTAMRNTIFLSILGFSSLILLNILRNGAWYLSPDPIELCDSTPDVWTIVPTASALRVQLALVNALPWSARIFKRNPMYSDAHHEMNASQTPSTVWFGRKIAELEFVSRSTTCSSAFLSIYMRPVATSRLNTKSDGGRLTRNR